MTVSECIKNWLCGYEKMDIGEIATDFVEGDLGSYAILKSPNSTPEEYSDGSRLITEFYQFFARKSTQIDVERIGNQQLLTDLEEWVEQKNFAEDYPDLSVCGRLACQDISISGSATILSQEETNAIYQIIISIQYLKER